VSTESEQSACFWLYASTVCEPVNYQQFLFVFPQWQGYNAITFAHCFQTEVIIRLYNNQINARALIGQSAMVYCASKPLEKSASELLH